MNDRDDKTDLFFKISYISNVSLMLFSPNFIRFILSFVTLLVIEGVYYIISFKNIFKLKKYNSEIEKLECSLNVCKEILGSIEDKKEIDLTKEDKKISKYSYSFNSGINREIDNNYINLNNHSSYVKKKIK